MERGSSPIIKNGGQIQDIEIVLKEHLPTSRNQKQSFKLYNANNGATGSTGSGLQHNGSQSNSRFANLIMPPLQGGMKYASTAEVETMPLSTSAN